MLNDEEKRILLKIARKSLEDYFSGRDSGNIEVPQSLKEKYGAFVTLKKKGQLRGCIGFISAIKPLNVAIRELALEAAFHDPRFNSLDARELEEVDIEISVLTPFERVKDANEIIVGKHGLYIKKGFHSGLLLPQVATEWGWDREKFLEQTCYKAGLNKEAWKDKDTEIYSFSAEVFGEKKYK